MSKASSPRKLTVEWNPTQKLWTEVPEQEGFFELSAPYSATWPPSGSMRNGVASPLRRSALPTPVGASSSSPGPLLPTPRTSDTNGPGAHGTGGPDPRTAISLLPTPAASFPGTTANFRPDGTPYSGGYGMTLLDAVRLLPTPRASDGTKGGPNQRGSKGDLMLPSAVTAHAVALALTRGLLTADDIDRPAGGEAA